MRHNKEQQFLYQLFSTNQYITNKQQANTETLNKLKDLDQIYKEDIRID